MHQAVADEFTRLFADRLAKLTVGPGLKESTDVGPLVNEATRDKVSHLVDGASAEGDRVVIGGRPPERRGYFYQPTVIRCAAWRPRRRGRGTPQRRVTSLECQCGLVASDRPR